MELTELINHPERMDRETLYELRSMVALYPYFQTARLLMLQNLYLLHDATFDEELRKTAIYITDRKVIFKLIEAAHYRLQKKKEKQRAESTESKQDRTISLIDNFLDSMPKDEEQEKGHTKRKPTAADAAVDYVAYLMEIESEEKQPDSDTDVPKLRGQNLIDTFLEDNQGKITLSEEPLLTPDTEEESRQEEDEPEESFFTEALARIYVKQGRYQKALEIITRLSEQHPNRNIYFDDQKRFLKKLIINNNKIN